MTRVPYNYYTRSHSWAYEKSRDLHDDILLGATITSKNLQIVKKTVTRWLDNKHRGIALLDGIQEDCWYEGGGWFHYRLADGVLIFLHSSGEDAFDTLEYYANSLVKALEDTDATAQVIWTEYPHRRRHLIARLST